MFVSVSVCLSAGSPTTPFPWLVVRSHLRVATIINIVIVIVIVIVIFIIIITWVGQAS